MATYAEWNYAFVTYFTIGVPRSRKIYLSVDDERLECIGRDFSIVPRSGNLSKDFCLAVRQEVTVEEQVDLSRLQGRTLDGLPQCLAFLVSTVLAAAQMANDVDGQDQISEANYFRRFRDILGLPGEGRPPGMKCGGNAEEPLWREWNRWLLEKGFQPSAQQGQGLARKFINYPISQCLLRQADKDRLQVLFAEKQWKAVWDMQTLFAQIRRESKNLPSHLQKLLTGDKQRYEAVAEAIHEVYQQWQAQGNPSTPKFSQGDRTWSRNLFAGLYREEDPFFGQVDYYLYPKQQRGRQLGLVSVEYQNTIQTLREERPGWYLPIGEPLSVQDLKGGVRCEIEHPSDLEYLILPDRDFWILIPDAEHPDSGIYASWGAPALGTPFILLCKRQLLKDLQRLRDERLLEWSGDPQAVEGSAWVELDRCMVTSQAWDGVIIDRQDFKEALQPTVRLSISFSGGLRVPSQQAWLAGYSPQVTVFGFSPKVDLKVSNLLNDRVVEKRSQTTNQPMSLNLSAPGIYLVRATFAEDSAEQFLRIVDWDGLEIADPQHQEWMSVGDRHFICGSMIRSVSELS